ncbi:MAG: tyramine oxidase, partial [Geodermatophilaceae bacterium]|nr:tyramine oxidase [Geodermatophilaceae bacterium]
YTDGTIEFEVKLTGVLTTGALAEGVKPEFGKLVAPGLYGPNHQHFFNVRMDMTVDGPNNSVYEVNSIPEPAGPTNPHLNAWRAVSTLLGSESLAVRDVKQETARFWTVVNPSSVNELGEPAGYKIMPGSTAPAMFQEGSWICDRARFVQHTLWVTAYEPKELYASGDYPYQSPVADGLPVYTAGDDSLVNTDVVVWYTVGAHHIVRPEDWPVMPVAYAGFHLKPVGFFDGNPALDMPPSTAAHGHAQANGHTGDCHCA